MKLLLDTHVLLWFVSGDERLSNELRRAIESPENACVVSIASLWEMAIKASIGKLALAGGFDRWVAENLRALDASVMPVEVAHAARVRALPWHHRDPFDRMLIATVDPVFAAYGVDLVG